MQFGRFAAADGFLKSSTNKYLAKMFSLDEAAAEIPTRQAVNIEDQRQNNLLSPPLPDFQILRTPPPRRPQTATFMTRALTPKLEMKPHRRHHSDHDPERNSVGSRIRPLSANLRLAKLQPCASSSMALLHQKLKSDDRSVPRLQSIKKPPRRALQQQIYTLPTVKPRETKQPRLTKKKKPGDRWGLTAVHTQTSLKRIRIKQMRTAYEAFGT